MICIKCKLKKKKMNLYNMEKFDDYDRLLVSNGPYCESCYSKVLKEGDTCFLAPCEIRMIGVIIKCISCKRTIRKYKEEYIKRIDNHDNIFESTGPFCRKCSDKLYKEIQNVKLDLD